MDNKKEIDIKSAIDHKKQEWVEYIRMKLEKIYEDSILFEKREVIDGTSYNFIALKDEFLYDLANFIFDLFERNRKNETKIFKL